jgi:hypothetical protein
MGGQMSRGRPPKNGIGLGLPVAKERGQVMEIVQDGSPPAAFVINADGKVHFIAIKRLDRFRAMPGEVEVELRSLLALIRSLPSGQDVVRELWVYSKAGTLRFFRVEDSWLLEIGRDGRPLGA